MRLTRLTSLKQLSWSITVTSITVDLLKALGSLGAQVVRKREKKQEEIKVEKKVVSEAGSEAPPETLADKVAQDKGWMEHDLIWFTVIGWDGNCTTLKWLKVEIHKYWAFMWHCSLKTWERERERARERVEEMLCLRGGSTFPVLASGRQ